MGKGVEEFAVEPGSDAMVSSAQPNGAANDRVEDGLNFGLRLADDSQDLAGRGLLVQRHGKIAIAFLKLREQPDILDGDHRLIGEGLEQGDLRVRE